MVTTCIQYIYICILESHEYIIAHLTHCSCRRYGAIVSCHSNSARVWPTRAQLRGLCRSQQQPSKINGYNELCLIYAVGVLANMVVSEMAAVTPTSRCPSHYHNRYYIRERCVYERVAKLVKERDRCIPLRKRYIIIV